MVLARACTLAGHVQWPSLPLRSPLLHATLPHCAPFGRQACSVPHRDAPRRVNTRNVINIRFYTL